MLVAAACAPSLAAPPHLVAAWPPDEARLPIAAHTLDLTFNRPLLAASAWAEVWREADGSPLPTDTLLDPNNPRQLAVHLQRPAAGQYRFHWHAVAAPSGAGADAERDSPLQDESEAARQIGVSKAIPDSGEKREVKGNGLARTRS